MQQSRIEIKNDPFRAAYLLRFGRYKETRFNGEIRCVVIEGDGATLSEENYRYRTGYALVDPLAYKESLHLLEELSAADKDPFEPIEEDLFDSEEEIELLTDEA